MSMLPFLGSVCVGFLTAFSLIFIFRLRVRGLLQVTVLQMAQFYLAVTVGTVLAWIATTDPIDAGFMAGYLAGIADILIRVLPRNVDEQA
jgi:hypothetical protein